MDNSLKYEKDNAVAILTINDYPYNRMSLNFMDALEERVTKIAEDGIRDIGVTGVQTCALPILC